MPKKTYTQINSVTLAASSSTVTFSSLPQNFRDLVLIASAASTGGGTNAAVRFNSDSGSNYSRVLMGANGVGAVGTAAGTQTGFQYDNWAFTTTTLGNSNHILQIMDYSATDKHKTILARANRFGETIDALAGRWANTAAITSVQVVSFSGESYIAGSTFTLYGIEA